MEKIARRKSKRTVRKPSDRTSRFYDDCDVSLLPNKYKALLELFICLDTSVNILISKKESLFLSNISKVIEERIKHKLSNDDFGRILFLFPQSYNYELMANDIKIAPNLTFGSEKNFSPRKTVSSFSLSQLLDRKTHFYKKLFDNVDVQHSEFLKSSQKVMRSSRTRKWHPDFQLDVVCTDIEPLEFKESEKLSIISPNIKSIQSSLDSPNCNLFKVLFKDTKTSASRKKSISNPDKENLLNTNFSPIKTINYNESENKVPVKTDLFIRIQKLPQHIKVIYEKFKNMEIAFTNCTQITFQDLAKKIKISMEDVGRILKLYPESYNIRWITKKTSDSHKFDLMIKPNLKSDGTDISNVTPKKEFLKFDNKRRIDRCHVFIDKCLVYVDDSYKVFLSNHLKMSSEEINDHLSNSPFTRNSKFNMDLHVPQLKPSDFPEKPVMMKDQKISSFLPTRKMVMSQLIAEDKQKQNPEFTGLSVLEKIRLRNAKSNVLTKQQYDENLQLKYLLDLIDVIFILLKGNKKLPRLEFVKLICESTKKDKECIGKLLDLLEEVCPGWLIASQGVFSLCSATNTDSDASTGMSVKQVKDKINDHVKSIKASQLAQSKSIVAEITTIN